MYELWRVLGYDELARRIIENLSVSDDIQVIEGPPGVGKSWLAEGIGREWEAQGGIGLRAEGDPGRSESALYPFRTLAGLSSRSGALSSMGTEFLRSGESFVGTHGLLSATVRTLTEARQRRRDRRMPYLGDSEQSLIYDLEKLGRKKPILLIADNLHWWDEESLDFLRVLRSQELRRSFPVLAAFRVVAVQTLDRYQSIANRRAHGDVLASGNSRHHQLRRIDEDKLEQALKILAAPSSVTPEEASLIFTLSGGHLVLARRAAAWTAMRGIGALRSAAEDPERFRATLLTERVHALGELGPRAVALLGVAANLGQSFRRSEIVCANSDEDAETIQLLRLCRDENVLELSDDSCRFAHDLLRQFFLSTASTEQASIHERLASCYRMLRPSDYASRSQSLIRAEMGREAGVFGAMAALQWDREGEDWRRRIPQDVLAATRAAGLVPFVENLSSARSALIEYRFEDCISTLDALPAPGSPLLSAESDYIRAMCLMSTRSERDRAHGRDCLERWRDLADTEPELGLRVLRLLMYGLTHLLDKGPARALESRIRRALIQRTQFDPGAQDDLYVLDRMAGSIYEPDVALPRVREASRHFGPTEGTDLLRRPIEYYRCLVNLGANEICNARYSDARLTYARVAAVVEEFADGVFPRPEYAAANSLLADYRLGLCDAAAAVIRQRTIVDSSREEDPYYMGNALAVYLALDGRLDESMAIYDDLDAKLSRTRREAEPSMQYLLGANRSVVKYLRGDHAGAARDWRELDGTLAKVTYTALPYLERRHTLLEPVLRDSTVTLSAREIDEYLPHRFPDEFGPLWDNYGRGFRMPEIEFWREN